MSNHNPVQTGITKYWVAGEDDRCALRQATKQPRRLIDLMLDGLWTLISTRRRTKFVGFGVFEWRPYRRRLPTGKMVETWRLTFKPSRYVSKRYKGEHENR